MKATRLIALLLAAAVAGCASAANPDGTQAPRRSQSVLTQAEMREAHHNNVYDAVAALRANWLRQRGQISFNSPGAGQVVVFMDGIRIGDTSYLRQVNVGDVYSVNFLNASEAAARFGLQTNSGPAIVINSSAGR